MNWFAEEDACLLGPHAHSLTLAKPQNIIQPVRILLYLVSCCSLGTAERSLGRYSGKGIENNPSVLYNLKGHVSTL